MLVVRHNHEQHVACDHRCPVDDLTDVAVDHHVASDNRGARDNGFVFARLGADNVANVRADWLIGASGPWPLDVFAHLET